MLSVFSNLKGIAAVLGAPSSTGAPVTGVSIDSRTIQPGELFFALRGPNHDGHKFVSQVLAAGACAAVVDSASGLDGYRLLKVADTLAALQQLAAEARRLWGGRVVCVTGSAGKTTTKDMIAAALSARLRVRKTEGNLNNEYGLPLSLLRLSDLDQAGVFELGMSHAGEIAALARIAQPDTGVVTCVAPVHLEFFENIAGIARAKYELIEGLSPDGTAVLNADDPLVSAFRYSGRVIKFGIDQASDIKEGSGVSFTAAGVRFTLPLPGRHNILNALAALAVAQSFGISADEVAAALRALRAPAMRGETIDFEGATLINDCYNSNPQAALSMLDWLERVPAKGRRIAVLGEMLELGPLGPAMHRQVGERAARAADYVIAVRGLAREIFAALPAGRGKFVETPEEAATHLASMLRPGDVVLLKASRGVHLERTIEELRKARV